MFVLGIQYDKLFVTNGYNSFIMLQRLAVDIYYKLKAEDVWKGL